MITCCQRCKGMWLMSGRMSFRRTIRRKRVTKSRVRRVESLFCYQGWFCYHFCYHSLSGWFSQQKERACEVFSQALCSGGDGGESNSPSKRANREMYYKLSRCFAMRSELPPTGFCYAGPLVLADD